MSITEAKAPFVAQYWGQNVFMYKGYTNINPVSTEALKSVKTGYLLLRTVEQLTDEEAIVIADLLYPSKVFTKNAVITRGTDYWKYITLKNKDGFLSIGEDKITVNFNTNMSLDSRFGVNIVDYLRSIGILLPFTYLNEENKPVTLSPDAIIKLGWVKIKE